MLKNIIEFNYQIRRGIFFLLAIPIISCNTSKTSNPEYAAKFNNAKKFYPFEKWREAFDHGLTQYTQTNCDKAKQIFDNLISGLIDIGENANEAEKIALFKKAILATNALNEECDQALIETGEREELCELTDQITIACGLDPKKYGSNEGLASEWREW